jgi:putative phosphoribosyl transferase
VASFQDERQPYPDRREAGVELARRLSQLKGRGDVVVLRCRVAGYRSRTKWPGRWTRHLTCSWSGSSAFPAHPELAMGAIASGGVRVLNDDIVSWYGIPDTVIEHVAREEQAELVRRERAYREGRTPAGLQNRMVLLIDDGLATGSTMKAAVEAVRAHGPSRIVLAVPVGSPETCREFTEVADEIVCARAGPLCRRRSVVSRLLADDG